MMSERFWEEGMKLSSCRILTDELVKDCVLGVILRNVVFAVYYLEFGSLFKWVLLETEQVQDAAQSLENKSRLFQNTTRTRGKT